MLGLTAAIEAATLIAFMSSMVPRLKHKPLECIACVTCATAAFYLHHRCVANLKRHRECGWKFKVVQWQDKPDVMALLHILGLT